MFNVTALICQNLTSKSKWWVLIITCKWVPNVKFDFDVGVDSRHCVTDTSKLKSTLGTFSNMCPEGIFCLSLFISLYPSTLDHSASDPPSTKVRLKQHQTCFRTFLRLSFNYFAINRINKKLSRWGRSRNSKTQINHVF